MSICLLILSGCGLIKFDYSAQHQEVIIEGSAIPAASGLIPLDVGIPMSVDFNTIAEQRDGSIASKVTLKKSRIFITGTKQPDSDTDDFTFIESVNVYIASTKEGSNLERRRIAWFESHVEQGEQVLRFEVDSSINLLPYSEEGPMITTESEGTLPPDDVSFGGETTFTIEVL